MEIAEAAYAKSALKDYLSIVKTFRDAAPVATIQDIKIDSTSVYSPILTGVGTKTIFYVLRVGSPMTAGNCFLGSFQAVAVVLSKDKPTLTFPNEGEYTEINGIHDPNNDGRWQKPIASTEDYRTNIILSSGTTPVTFSKKYEIFRWSYDKQFGEVWNSTNLNEFELDTEAPFVSSSTTTSARSASQLNRYQGFSISLTPKYTSGSYYINNFIQTWSGEWLTWPALILKVVN